MHFLVEAHVKLCINFRLLSYDCFLKLLTICCGLFFRLADCGSLSSPFHGMVRLTGTLQRSEAIYTCGSGYVIVGNDTRECLPDGTWSGEVPHCVLANLVAMIGAVVAVALVLLFVGLVLVACCFICCKKKRHLKHSTHGPKIIEFSYKR